jgi:toxin-antitoxin system PIN domain toxin
MTSIADANVLFPLLVQGHAAHEVAMGWWDKQEDVTVATCLVTRLAVLRLLTNRVAMNGAPVNPEAALDAWRRLSNDPRSFHIDAQPVEHEARFESLVSSREPAPNLWADAWLAALAISLDSEFTTFDRGFKSFRGLRLNLLEMPDR